MEGNYNHLQAEQKWQQNWATSNLYDWDINEPKGTLDNKQEAYDDQEISYDRDAMMRDNRACCRIWGDRQLLIIGLHTLHIAQMRSKGAWPTLSSPDP